MRIRELTSRIPGDPVGRTRDGAYIARVLARTGVVGAVRPDKLGRMLVTYARWGNTPATASALAAVRVLSWREDGDSGDETIDELIHSESDDALAPPPEEARFVILTSGTTGTPKGAQRSSPSGLGGIAGLLDKIPFRNRETMMIAAPLF